MTYSIARAALHEFVERGIRLVESTPIPPDLASVCGAELAAEELIAVWLAAGVATQIGLAILEAPERFVGIGAVAAGAGGSGGVVVPLPSPP